MISTVLAFQKRYECLVTLDQARNRTIRNPPIQDIRHLRIYGLVRVERLAFEQSVHSCRGEVYSSMTPGTVSRTVRLRTHSTHRE